MKKLTSLVFLLLTSQFCLSQPKENKSKPKEKATTDTTIQKVLEDAKSDVENNLATVALDDNDLNDGNNQNVSSLLTAGRDPFYSAAAYNFSALRFRVRGYDGDLSSIFINGISMDNLDNGFTPFALWGGLNDVTRNKDFSIGLRPNSFAFGDIGNSTFIDVRAIKQRKQTEIGYSFSNRNYVHNMDITHGTGLNKKGWAASFMISRRYADEAYFPGTFYNSTSFYASVDKKLGYKHTLSLAAFASPTSVGRQGLGTKEVFEIMGRDYNPNWGWQMGKKRNANIIKTFQPVAILSHEYKIKNSTSILTAASISFGDRSSSIIDWYKGDNPNPLYYRNLPSYYDDPTQAAAIRNAWQTDQNVSQINWHKMYYANYGNIDSVNGVVGKRSSYVQGAHNTNTTRYGANSVINARLNDFTDFTGGISYQAQNNKYTKRMLDLLGGDYFVDRNQFAERFNPANANYVGQSNVLTPNRLIRVGDDYGYNYEIRIQRTAAWAQFVTKFEKMDWFSALEVSNTNYYRVGKYQNGLFPTNSLGDAPKQNFTNTAFKTGITYKLNGKNYFFGNVTAQTKAPFFDNVYVSPQVRNSVQDKVSNEKVNSVEGGYVLNDPRFKVRLTGYYTEFRDQMNVLNYFDDVYQNRVNYALTGINKTHSGLEFGAEARFIKNITLNVAAAVGRYYYNSTQNAVTTIDNDASEVSRDLVYSKGYYVGGTPQQAYSTGIYYRSPKFWNVSLTYNYFDEIYAEINPVRRTAKAVQGIALDDPLRNVVLDQTKLSSQQTLDFYGSWSYKLPKKWSVNNKNTFIVFSLSVSNLLDNKTIIPFYTENQRFNVTELDYFPGRYNYGYGRNFSASIAFRFN